VTPLCRVDDIPESGGLGLVAEVGGGRRSLLAVRRGGEVFVYLNACPHIGAPLNMLPNRFLDAEGRHIQCANHGALFRLEDGACVSGPCAGEALSPVPVTIRAGTVYTLA
jgi:nitrite reductase/ring-hydroxylating ferredoxin subunit